MNIFMQKENDQEWGQNLDYSDQIRVSAYSTSRVSNLFCTADRFQLGIIMRTDLDKLMFATCKLQLVSHHGTNSVRDLGLLCRNKMLRPVGIMVVK